MVELLLAYKWLLVIAGEVLFWVLSALFVVLRYWFRFERASFFFLVLFGLNELFAAGLAVLDYASTGVFGEFQIVMVVFLLYAVTFGKQDFKRLDAYLKRKVAGWRGQAVPPEAAPAPREKRPPSGQEHARKERRGFYGHLLIFAIGQVILLVLGESWIAAELGGEAPRPLSGLMTVGRVWCIILIVDGIWSLSYTVFPRRARG